MRILHRQFAHKTALVRASLAVLTVGVTGCEADHPCVNTGVPGKCGFDYDAYIDTVAPSFAVVGERYEYRPDMATSDPGIWEFYTAPEGMTITDGVVSWVPTAEQAGVHEAYLAVYTSDRMQSTAEGFTVTVAHSTRWAQEEVAAEDGGTAVATAPGSPIQGAGIIVGEHALREDQMITMSALSLAPRFEGTENEVTAVQFGPSGLQFDRPATIVLPFDNTGIEDPNAVGAFFYDETTSTWTPIQVVNVDLPNGVLEAIAPHFSIYAAGGLSGALDVGAATNTATNKDVVWAQADLESIAAKKVTGAHDVADVSIMEWVSDPTFYGTISCSTELRIMNGFSEVPILDGSFGSRELNRIRSRATLFVDRDRSARFSADWIEENYASLDDPEALASALHRLGGYDRVFNFAPVNATNYQAYFRCQYKDGDVPAGDFLKTGPDTAVGQFSRGGALAPFDSDGDGDSVRDEYDPEPDVAPVNLAVWGSDTGQLVWFSMPVNADPLSVTWEIISGPEGARVEPVTGEMIAGGRDWSPWGAVLIPAADAPLAFYTLRFSGTLEDGTRYSGTTYSSYRSGGSISSQFSLTSQQLQSWVLSPLSGVLGTSFDLECDDVKGFTTKTRWVFIDSESMIHTDDNGLISVAPPSHSDRDIGRMLASFTPTEPGTYRLACQGFTPYLGANGDWTPIHPASIRTVVVDAPPDNSAPVISSFSPLAETVEQGTSVTFTVKYDDRDPDKLTVRWVVDDEVDSTAVTVIDANHASVLFSTEGSHTVKAIVSDHALEVESLTAFIFVTPPESVLVDADGDGYYAGTEPGYDCDDTYEFTNPEGEETCDGSDNNCDAEVDEGGVCE